MNKIKTILNAILLLSFFTTFISCNGQKKSKTIDKANEIGVTVSQLDKTIWTIYQDKKSNYWFGSKENGVFLYNGKQIKQITTKDGLVSNEIRGFQEDLNGNIFIETEKGVSKFDGNSFTTLQMKNEAASSNNWVLNPEDLWFRIGFNKKGVYRFDGQYLQFLKFPKAPQEDAFYKKNYNASFSPYGLYTIYKDRQGFMWFGTTSLGVCHFNGKTFSWYYEEQLQTTPNGGDFGTRAIFEDKKGFFWINNTRFRYDIVTDNDNAIAFKKENGIGYTNENKEIEFPFFLSITDDNDGNLWMVTYDDGVYKFDGKELIHYPINDGETKVLLFTIYKDNQGVLWLGSHNAGIYKFNGNTFEQFLN